MKSTFAAAAALVGSVSAAAHGHGHAAFHGLERRIAAADNGTCGCTTIYTTYHGKPTTLWPSAPPATSTFPVSSYPVVPTPVAHTCPTPGVYTFPPETVTLTSETTVCVPSTTAVTSGSVTYGGVTTVVTTSTVVTCPYAAVETHGDVTTSVVKETTYVCPSAGTYTPVQPTTTYVPSDTTITVPAIASYTPGTYTAPEVVTTVTDTKTVVYCPFATPSSSSAPAPSVPAPTSAAVTYPAAPVAPTYEAATPPAATYTAVPSPQPEPSYTPAPPSGGLGGNTPGKPWAMTFTPYLPAGGGCMSYDQVDASIKAIAASGIKTIRTYSTDCDTLPNVGKAARKYGVKMMIGIFVDQPGCQAAHPTIAQQIDDIAAWAQWDLVPLAVIGNEAIINGHCTAGQIASLIQTCKSKWTGYTGPYTTAETVNVWQQQETKSALCGVVDKVGANAWAFFNLATSAQNAGSFVKSQLEIINNVCSGKEGYVLETGWPSAGNAMGAAVPGAAEQAAAIKSIISECGDKVVVLSPFNDSWKDGNTACACEQHFGVGNVINISGLPF